MTRKRHTGPVGLAMPARLVMAPWAWPCLEVLTGESSQPVIDSPRFSPPPSPSGRPPVGKGGGRWASIDEQMQQHIGCHS